MIVGGFLVVLDGTREVLDSSGWDYVVLGGAREFVGGIKVSLDGSKSSVYVCVVCCPHYLRRKAQVYSR